MKRIATVLLAAALALGGACGGEEPAEDDTTAPDDDTMDPDDPEKDEWDERLEERAVDYSAALRLAALRLTGDLPTLAEIEFVAYASDQKVAYEALIEQYMDDPRFARQMFRFWRDTLKMGDAPALDTAAAFAAQVTVEGRPFTELLTAQTGTCPTFDPIEGAFVAGDCANNVPVHAGLLTHPGVHAHFRANMAFRRTRWVQETFACKAFPAEVGEPQDLGGAAVYTAPWPFESISGAANGGSIDFLDLSSVACANCHATMNHIAPLFANFDENGMWQEAISVTKPTEGTPNAEAIDWLPPGEQTAWRFGVPAADLPALGQAMAADPEVIQCGVARVWNWAFGKTDIVDSAAIVPTEVTAEVVARFEAGGLSLRDAIHAVFTSDDFVKF